MCHEGCGLSACSRRGIGKRRDTIRERGFGWLRDVIVVKIIIPVNVFGVYFSLCIGINIFTIFCDCNFREYLKKLITLLIHDGLHPRLEQ